jgi:hypothetical protein
MVTMGNQEFNFDSFPKLINVNCLSKSVPTSIYGSLPVTGRIWNPDTDKCLQFLSLLVPLEHL